MNNRYLIFEEKEADQILSDIKEIKEILNKRSDPNPLPDRWLTPPEVCKLLSVPPKQLWNYRNSKQICFSKIESKIYFNASDIQNFLEKNYNGRLV